MTDWLKTNRLFGGNGLYKFVFFLQAALLVGMLGGCGAKQEESEVRSVPEEPIKVEETQEIAIDTVSADDLQGIWQYAASTPAGDPYVFQLEVGEDGVANYSTYSMSGDCWFQNMCYDGMLEIMQEYDPENGTGDGDAGDAFFVKLELSELDENGSETDRLTGEYSIKFEDQDHTALVIKHLSGRYLAEDGQERPITFEKVDQAISAGISVMGEIFPGVYYDPVIYESEDIDSGFIGVALNPDGQALMVIQDAGWGSWDASGELNIDHVLMWNQQINGGEDVIYLENGEQLVSAPPELWPEGFERFMENGTIPNWIADVSWQNAYWSFLWKITDSPYDSTADYFDKKPENTSFELFLDGKKADEYFLYDVDKDGRPEMMVRFGTGESDYQALVITSDVNGSLTCLGTVAFDHTEFYSKPGWNGILMHWMNAGTSVIGSVGLREGELVYEKIWEEYINGHGEPVYSLPSEFVEESVALTAIDIQDTVAISQYREKYDIP